MKISTILIALTLLFALACGNKKTDDHGHEHGTDSHEHMEDGHSHGDGDHTHETTPQEEFTVDDSTAKGTHTHEDGATHHDH